MGRIPDGELERIKREVDLVGLVRARGVKLVPHGKDLLGLCPFHEDHEPSLVVTPSKGLWHCLGACDQGGSAVDWVMKAEGVSFRHAVEILRDGGPPPAFGAAPVKRSTVLKLPPAVGLGAEDAELLLQVVDYYHSVLKTAPEALAYLKSRGVADPSAIEAFKLGYANRTLGLRLPTKERSTGLKLRHHLRQQGILRGSGHEHFNGCLVIPVLDERGQVAEIYGRKLRDDLREGTAYHLYLPGPHRGVWNLSAFRASKEIILCEALIDALTFWCAGFANVTSSYGVNGFTEEILEAMKAYGTERVLIAYDRDEAGDRAAQDLAKKLAGEGITSFRVRFPRGMDANEYACKVTPATQSLAVLLRAAEYMAGPVVKSAERRALSAEGPPPAQRQRRLEGGASPLAAASPGDTIAEAVPEQPPPAPTGNQQPTTDNQPLASPVPPAPRVELPADVSEQEVVIRLGDRRWRVRGLSRNMSFEQLKVNVLVARDGQATYHVDTLDLYSAKQRSTYIRQAATEIGLKDDVVKRELGQVLLKLEQLQEEQIKKALEPKRTAVAVDGDDRQVAMQLLKDPKLLERILEDFQCCGVVGEETNKLVGYLAAVSRKLDEPLAVIIQSSSAAGKSALMEAVLAFVPEEERVHYSAMTGQSLFYMGEADLAHKILAIAEEEGAERASYALKLLQSEGELTIASTGKDPSTGRLVTHEYRVEGPVGIFLTTTAIDLDEELLNRCLVLTVNEDRDQTRAIHKLQRERHTLEGLLAKQDREAIVTLHRNAQRLLKPLLVANPFARHLTFLDDKTRTRRDHLKYLTLIRTIALLHQHQRPVKTVTHSGRPLNYIDVTLEDIEVANRLAHEVLGRSLDELPPQTRRFLTLLQGMVQERCKALSIERQDYRFTRREVCEHTAWSLTQVRLHLDRLVEMEYILTHRGGRGQSFVYELVYAGQGTNGKTFLLGLLDVEEMRTRQEYDPNLADFSEGVADQKGQVAGSKRPQNAPKTGGWRTEENAQDAHSSELSTPKVQETPENAHLEPQKPSRSYVPTGRTQLSLPLAAAADESHR